MSDNPTESAEALSHVSDTDSTSTASYAPEAGDRAAPASTGETASTSHSAPSAPALHKGRVTRVTAEQVFVALEDGRTGAVPLIEFAGQPLPKDADEVSVLIEHEDPQSGTLALSKRGADELSFWE